MAWSLGIYFESYFHGCQEIFVFFIYEEFYLKVCLITQYSVFRYLVLDIADNPVENIIRFFPMTKEFIDESLQSGGKVLVHGNAGISRRYDCCLCYCIHYGNIWNEVQEYEAIYLAKLTIQMMSPLQIERSLSVHSGSTGSLKRTHEEEDDFGNMQVAAAQNG
ncbi:STYX [Cervus elaphus hippelaphus]|uniref:STYX n=1 Tax=Cervus elaphus hippelaphus TaxID=46360 RepID=A0A212CV18_CEREH|nr:STYX [Cervus elaphus hippelaphus]